MNDYESNVTLDDACERMLDAKSIVVTTHAKPDGDAIGAVIALSLGLRNAGVKEVGAFVMPPLPASLRLVSGADTVAVLDAGQPMPEAKLTVIVDTGAWAQVAPIRDDLARRLDRTLILDHHLSGDIPAALRYIDINAASSCEVVADAIDVMADLKGFRAGEKLWNAAIAEALFVGVAADTGWFRFSNTRPETHELAARLLQAGVDHAALYQKLEQTERPEKLMLMIRALASLKLVADGRAAIMVLRKNDFTETGALLEETERFVDLPQAVATVDVVVLITEPPSNGAVRLSFRSKPGPNAANMVTLAAPFGGGGHARAAGAKVEAPLDEVVKRVTEAVVRAVENR